MHNARAAGAGVRGGGGGAVKPIGLSDNH